MPKRMTDTDKWKKPFIKSLPLEYKIFWLYLLDDCDHAGIWHADFEVAELRLGTKLSQKKAEGLFEQKVVLLDNGSKWFIPDFITFQYGELTEKNKMYKPVSLVLNKYHLMGHLSPINGVKDKVKEKDMVKGEGVQGEYFNTMPFQNDLTDLPEINIGAAIEFVRITKQTTLKKEQVREMWEVFKIQNLTGKKYYADQDAVYSHFLNWIKTQNFNNGTDKSVTTKARTGKSAGAYAALEQLEADIARLGRGSEVN